MAIVCCGAKEVDDRVPPAVIVLDVDGDALDFYLNFLPAKSRSSISI